MLKANRPSIRRQQAIECRIALCSANQHQTDAVPLSRRGSASRNLLPTNLLAGELEKDAPASTSRTTWFMVSNRLHTQQHFTSSWPIFLPKAACNAKVFSNLQDKPWPGPFSLALASESVWNAQER